MLRDHRRPVHQQQPSRYETSSGRPGASDYQTTYNSRLPIQQQYNIYQQDTEIGPYGNNPSQGGGTGAGLEEGFRRNDAADVAILGSGNFDVLKGGTFVDRDVLYYSDQNRRPNPNLDAGDNILYNFRDFADIKNELYQYK